MTRTAHSIACLLHGRGLQARKTWKTQTFVSTDLISAFWMMTATISTKNSCKYTICQASKRKINLLKPEKQFWRFEAAFFFIDNTLMIGYSGDYFGA